MAAVTTRDYLASLRLDGRGVVVVGSGDGIGGAVCDAIGQAGGKVLCVDLDEERAERSAARSGGRAAVADATDDAALDRVFDEAEAWFGADFAGVVDVVGVTLPALLADQDAADVQRQFDLVLKPALRIATHGIPRLAARGRGSVVLVGSLAGLGSTLRIGMYGVAKAAVHQLVTAAAHEYGPDGIRVNGVVPGRIVSSGTMRPDPEALARVEQAVPLRRAGEPADIAGAVLFLLSDLATYVSGVNLVVDGGMRAVSPLPSTQPMT